MKISDEMVERAVTAFGKSGFEPTFDDALLWEHAMRAALEAAVGEMVLVPREPTDEMIWAGRDAWAAALDAMKNGESRSPMTETYAALLAAANGER